MMGTSHAASGAAAWLALTATSIPALGVYELSPGTVLLGVGVAAGAALLPDADHHNATIAHSVPVAGRIAAGAVGALSGGHRKGMHSLLAVVLVIFGMLYLGRLSWQPDGWDVAIALGPGIAAGACVTFASKVLKIVRSWPLAWVLGGAFGLLVAFLSSEQTSWLPWAIGAGYLTHILGDMLTAGGVPLLWPLPVRPPKAIADAPILGSIWLKHGAFALPVLGLTGSWREQALFLCFCGYALWGVCGESVAAIRGFIA